MFFSEVKVTLRGVSATFRCIYLLFHLSGVPEVYNELLFLNSIGAFPSYVKIANTRIRDTTEAINE